MVCNWIDKRIWYYGCKMKIKYDKGEKNKIIISGLFVIFLCCLFVFMESRNNNITIMLVGMPIVIIILIKIVLYLLYIYRNKSEYYLELDNEKITYYSIADGQIEIKLSNIQDIQFDESGMRIFVNYNIGIKRSWLYALFQYYVEDLKNMYQIPILGKLHDMKMFSEKVKQRIVVETVCEDVQAFANLCGAYIFIIAGIIWGFFVEAFCGCNLQQNFLKLLGLLMFEIFMHVFNKSALGLNKFRVGLLLRCMGCSLTVAQYILCACQLEEVVKGINMGLESSKNSVIAITIIYFIIFILYVPSYGLGKKLILKIAKKRN